MATPKNVHIKYDNSLRNVIFDTLAHRKSWSVVLSYLNEYGKYEGEEFRCANVNKLTFERFEGNENDFQNLVKGHYSFVVITNETYNIITWGNIGYTHHVEKDDPRHETHVFSLVRIGRNSGRVVYETKNPLKFARTIKEALIGEVYLIRGNDNEGINLKNVRNTRCQERNDNKFTRYGYNPEYGYDKSGYRTRDHFDVSAKLCTYKANKRSKFVHNKINDLFERAFEVIENSDSINVKAKRFARFALITDQMKYNEEGRKCFWFEFELHNLCDKGFENLNSQTIHWMYDKFTKNPNLIDSIISELQMID